MRTAGGVIGGYLAMFLVVFVLASISWVVLGASGSFEPGTWQTTMNWTVSKLIVDTIASLVGGYVCYRIGGRTASLVLAGIIIVLGFGLAYTALGTPAPTEPRPEVVGLSDAMMNARESAWALYASPVLAAAAVLIMMMRGEKKKLA